MLKETPRGRVLHVFDPESDTDYLLRRFRGSGSAYRALCGLHCPHLPQIYRVEEEDGQVSVLEEFVDGPSLGSRLREGSLRASQVPAIMRSLCDALQTLHTAGIVHRDIKPDNILLRPEGAVLIDFDAARLYESASSADTQVLGTVGYAAPEQFGLAQSDHRADIYAMGVLLNILLTGKHPSVGPLAPGAMGKVVQRCTMANPDKRYQSAAALGRALKRARLRPAMTAAAALFAAALLLCALRWLPGPSTATLPPADESPSPSQEMTPPPSPAESPSAVPVQTRYDITEVKTASKADLIGAWHYIALCKADVWTGMTGTFVFTENTLTYDSTYTSSITFDGNVINILDWNCTMTCWYNAAGQLVIYDSRDMYYILENKVTAELDPNPKIGTGSFPIDTPVALPFSTSYRRTTGHPSEGITYTGVTATKTEAGMVTFTVYFEASQSFTFSAFDPPDGRPIIQQQITPVYTSVSFTIPVESSYPADTPLSLFDSMTMNAYNQQFVKIDGEYSTNNNYLFLGSAVLDWICR